MKENNNREVEFDDSPICKDWLDVSKKGVQIRSMPRMTLEEIFKEITECCEQQYIPIETVSFPPCTGFVPSKIYVDEIKSYTCQFRRF